MNENFIKIILSKGNFSKLTSRERDCLIYLFNGRSAKHIAQVLSISPRTVEIHISNLKKKLACRTRLEVVSRLLENLCFC